MRIALYSRKRDEEEQRFLRTVVEYLLQQNFEVLAHRNCQLEDYPVKIFATHENVLTSLPIDFMISVGGDGSFIDAANLVGDLNIPLVGINTGRIGFLSGIKKDNFRDCIQYLLEKKYSIEKRSLMHFESSEPVGINRSFVINDVTVRATDCDSINAITVWADGHKINTYWADGLIVATPTGSTAYSLSCGGPILHPQTQVQILTPIASHSLSVRPLVIPADVTLKIQVAGRLGKYSLAVDTERITVSNEVELYLHKENFSIQTVLFENTDFYNIIREKLLWGLDKRNA